MQKVMKEMKDLKEKATSEKAKERTDQKFISMKEERDWFRTEALRLNKKCKEYEALVNKMKGSLENVTEDRDFF